VRRFFPAVLTVLLAAVGAAAISLALSDAAAPITLGTTGFAACLVLFLYWPWAVLPVTILATPSAAVIAGYTNVRSIVIAHLLPLSAAVVAVFVRWLTGREREWPSVHLAWPFMFVTCATTAAGALFGLVRGNDPKDIVVASYQIAVIPLYFMVTMLTLSTHERRRRATILYVVLITAISAPALLIPGRHGSGLFSLLPLPLLLVATGEATGRRRLGLALVCTLLGIDVALGDYRSVWLAATVTFAILLIRGAKAVRVGLATTTLLALGALAASAVTIGFHGGLIERVSDAAASLTRSAGYRGPESAVGWDVFGTHPFVGAGLGQTTKSVYLEGFAVTDVGPVYHSFYILLLANVGIIGFCAVLWPIVRTTWRSIVSGSGASLICAALTAGFLLAAAAAGPTDGHWELGLLPALAVLSREEHGRRPDGDRSSASARPHALLGAGTAR